MKRFFVVAALMSLLAIFAMPVSVYARVGDLGFFGGISEGRRLPRTTETRLLQQAGTRPSGGTITMAYKEPVFLNGRPEIFEGLLDITSGAPGINSTAGTFQVTKRVRPGDATGDVIINRVMNFTVEYWVEGTQMMMYYNLNQNNWSETITVGGNVFTLDNNRSSMVVAVIEDRTPGITFYRGDISTRLFYTDATGNVTNVVKHGFFTGFHNAWSATETQRLDVEIINDDWAMSYQVRPSVTVNKVLQFVSNEPTVISFEGNYRELHQSFAGLRYDIFIIPHFMWDEPEYGTMNLERENVFEQLPAPDTTHLRGHPAEDDIHRLFAMQVLQGDPRTFIPGQAITRGQFMTALARAIKIPVEPQVLPRGTRRPPPVVTLFDDVDSTRQEFRYIQALNRAGVAFGRADGRFHIDAPVSRQEAFATIIRALGLTIMGLNPTVVTPFVDTDTIADWAIREVGVAYTLGLIFPDEDGFIHPNRAISKAEAAALFNNLIDYLRMVIVSDYADQIVNIAR